ncbi:MAG: nuclear transport factor 2 family protein [Candidatus Acidiferrales bacterium]
MKALIVACFLLAASLIVPAQNNTSISGDEGTILVLENAWNKAEMNKDGQALDELLANSLVYVDYDGSLMDKDQFVASVKNSTVQSLQLVNDNVHVHMYGESAVVSGVYHEKGVEKGRSYTRNGRFVDTWVKVSNTWQCVASQSTLLSK